MKRETDEKKKKSGSEMRMQFTIKGNRFENLYNATPSTSFFSDSKGMFSVAPTLR